MVNRTRVEGGGYSKHDIITSVVKKEEKKNEKKKSKEVRMKAEIIIVK